MSQLDWLSVRKFTLIVATAGWIAGTAFGFRALIRHENQPGDAGRPVALWPSTSRIARTSKPTLLMAVHPQCPCSHASVGELALIMARAQGLLDVHVLFYKPNGFKKEWTQNDLWRQAVAIPGVSVELDEDAREARRFGVTTSGHVMLFDRQGKLMFQGGITPSRAHSGDNAGRAAILALVHGLQPERQRTLVFGCSLGEVP